MLTVIIPEKYIPSWENSGIWWDLVYLWPWQNGNRGPPCMYTSQTWSSILSKWIICSRVVCVAFRAPCARSERRRDSEKKHLNCLFASERMNGIHFIYVSSECGSVFLAIFIGLLHTTISVFCWLHLGEDVDDDKSDDLWSVSIITIIITSRRTIMVNTYWI